MQIISHLRTHPLLTGLLLMAAYFTYFIVPGVFGPNSFGRGHGVDTAADMNKELVSEIGLVSSILIVLAILGWWKSCGFTLKLNKGGMKFVLLPLVFTLLFLGYAALTAKTDNQTLVKIIGPGPLATLVLVTMLVGIFEETLFRGVVFMGWQKRYGPVLAVFVSAVFFGAFHFVNWINEQPFEQTWTQVLHAFYVGTMYAALRLRIGSIYPVMILHGFWDATVMIMGSTTTSLAAHTARTLAETPATQTGDGSSVFAIVFSSIEPLYGLFVLWRWHVWRKHGDQA